jgi:hypothetical protein
MTLNIDTQFIKYTKDNHMAPIGGQTHRHASGEILQNMIIAYITY